MPDVAEALLISASIAARIGAERFGQASISRAKSGDFLAKSAKQCAKRSPSVSGRESEVSDSQELAACGASEENWF
jgi:hypothetical protein